MSHLLRALLAAAFAATASSAVVSSQEECSDVPIVWTDPDGDGCDVYGRSGWCGAPWTENFATIGRTASQACCVCGGGLRTKAFSAPMDELSEPVAKPALAPAQSKTQDDIKEPSKPIVQEEKPSPAPAKVKLETPMVDSTSVRGVAIGSFHKDEVASLKAEVAELQNKLKDRDHMAATLEQAAHEEARRAKAQESSLDARLSNLEGEFHESERRLSNATPAAPSQQASPEAEIMSSEAELKAAEVADAPATAPQDAKEASAESAELMQDVGQLHGLVHETQAKLRGMSQQIAGLRASVTALGGHAL